MSHDNFIEVYEGALSPEFCNQAVSMFESFPQAHSPGQIGSGVDQSKKHSVDCCISEFKEWESINQQIFNVTLEHLARYIRKYSHLVCGSLAPAIELNGQPTELTSEVLPEVSDEQLMKIIFHLYRPGFLNLQKYHQGVGGFHHWHSEIYPREQNCETLHRVLLFMFFLNSVTEGGETEFLYQQQKVIPEQGTMVIAPAGFTHTHKGGVPESGDKYIVTSWILFQRAENIFQHPAG